MYMHDSSRLSSLMLHVDIIDWGEYENIKMHGQIHPGLGHNTSFVGP